MVYVFQCESSHTTEKNLTPAEFDSQQRTKTGDMFIDCDQCQQPAVRQYHAARAVYACSGVYGNMSTDVAHNTGMIHG